jgi:hypothetical protein
LLRKATAELPHEGGVRIEKGSQEHLTLVRWIGSGMAYEVDGEATLTSLNIEPSARIAKAGEAGQFQAEAQFSDGSSRDVTHLTDFNTDSAPTVTVEEDGAFRMGTEPGEGVVVARYMGKVAIADLSIPPTTLFPHAEYERFETRNFIDRHLAARWQGLGLLPSEPCTESEFLRRASLSLIGRLPSPEQARQFLADTSPDKRRHLIDTLLLDPNWANHWAIKWIDLLRPNPDRVGIKSVYVLDEWIRGQFRANVPFDEFATEVLTASGSTHRHGPTVVFRDRREPENLTTSMSQIFLGVRLECARCHHHPNERWSQDDFFQLAAFFGQVKRKGTGISPPISGSPEFFFNGRSGSVTHPVSGVLMKPVPPAASEFSIPDSQHPRSALAGWLTEPENPFFARAVANRVWAEMMGTGIVNPVDDFRVSNPPSNPALLDALAADFVESGFDLKHLMRRIANSSSFALSSLPNETNVGDTEHFSRAYRRRLPAEVMADAVDDVTGVTTNYEGMPPATRAVENWNFKIASNLLDAFGRPDSSEDCPCERNLAPSVVQSLHLMHSDTLSRKLADKSGRVAKLAASDTTVEAIIEELYLAAFNRPPNDDELKSASELFADPETTRQTASEDLLWVLLNSAEFVFNH